MPARLPEDYFQARSQFRLAARTNGAELKSHVINARGPDDEELTIDVAVIGSSAPGDALIISSGLHGVEGFLGSALQIQALVRRVFEGMSPHRRVVLLHALNPYGFAHLRRVNEDNVDLNRNFISGPINDGDSAALYAKLDPFLNPRHPPSKLRNALFPIDAYRMIRRYGIPVLKQVIAEGQFQFPRGLFFGGTAPCQSTRIVQDHLAEWAAGASRVLHVDIHTGLGEYGKLKLLLDNRYSQPVHQQLKAEFPELAVDRHDSSAGAYQARGTLAQWCEQQRRDQSYMFLCAEFGTYKPLKVLQALRSENHAHHWSCPPQSIWYYTKQRLRECFYPDSQRWRDEAMAAGMALVECVSSS